MSFFRTLIAVATMVGCFSFAMLDPNAMKVPLIGASGGIFGIITFYLIMYPFRRFVFFALTRWIAIPAVLFGVIFVFFNQFTGSLMQISVASSVSYLSHLGGALIGLAFAMYVRFKEVRI